VKGGIGVVMFACLSAMIPGKIFSERKGKALGAGILTLGFCWDIFGENVGN